jgi:hypothetical protein
VKGENIRSGEKRGKKTVFLKKKIILLLKFEERGLQR